MDKNELKKRMLKNHTFLENETHSQIHMGALQLSRHLPNIFKAISPKISKTQSHYNLITEDDIRQKKDLFNNGMINCHVCINAMTNDSHAEMDSFHALTCVPKQFDENYKRLETKFLFQINDDTTICVPMHERMAFMHSGFMLSHHQVLEKKHRSNTTFINLATHGNKRLFHNMMSSFRRDLL